MSKKTNTEKILVIVESPNKVKTISSILKNAGYTKAVVMASVGHIVILADGGPTYNSGIYPNKKFQMNLVVDPEKKKVVAIDLLQNTTEQVAFNSAQRLMTQVPAHCGKLLKIKI